MYGIVHRITPTTQQLLHVLLLLLLLCIFIVLLLLSLFCTEFTKPHVMCGVTVNPPPPAYFKPLPPDPTLPFAQ